MHVKSYLSETAEICALLDAEAIERMAEALSKIKGRIYLIGLGGSLANCIHMAADLRKLCGLDAIAPNLAEMTAWINDEGPANAFTGYLTRMTKNDALFILSVGGGRVVISPGITVSVRAAKKMEIQIFGIVGPEGGETAKLGDYVIKIPIMNSEHITPHTEAFQAVIWHCLVSHPLLQKSPTKW